jgi:hypothetical protein
VRGGVEEKKEEEQKVKIDLKVSTKFQFYFSSISVLFQCSSVLSVHRRLRKKHFETLWGQADHLTIRPSNRINRATRGKSAPDVTLVHNSLVTGATWKQLPIRGSDNYPLLCEVDMTYSHHAVLDSKLKWDWRNGDWENFQKEMEQTVSYVRPRDLRWSLKKKEGEAILEAAKNHVGMVRTRDSGQCWMTTALKAAMKRRNLLGRTIGSNREQWLEACREVRSLTRCAKQNSWCSFVESMKGKTSLSHVWLVIRSLNGNWSPPMARNTVLEHGGRASFLTQRRQMCSSNTMHALVATSSLGLKGKLTMPCVLD